MSQQMSQIMDKVELVEQIVDKIEDLDLDKFIKITNPKNLGENIEEYWYLNPSFLKFRKGTIVIDLSWEQQQYLTQLLTDDYKENLGLPYFKTSFIATKNEAYREILKRLYWPRTYYNYNDELVLKKSILRNVNVTPMNGEFRYNGEEIPLKVPKNVGFFNDFGLLPTKDNLKKRGKFFWNGDVSAFNYSNIAATYSFLDIINERFYGGFDIPSHNLLNSSVLLVKKSSSK